jgi:UDP-N-acetylenolpyruvoylglucosamine reductase
MKDGIIGLITIVFIALIVGTAIWYNYGTDRALSVVISEKPRTLDRTSSKWLIFTGDGRVLENSDSILRWKFNSSTLQARMKVGQTCVVKVYGKRVPFLSMHPNILEVVGCR